MSRGHPWLISGSLQHSKIEVGRCAGAVWFHVLALGSARRFSINDGGWLTVLIAMAWRLLVFIDESMAQRSAVPSRLPSARLDKALGAALAPRHSEADQRESSR